jgi:hypothetical protein
MKKAGKGRQNKKRNREKPTNKKMVEIHLYIPKITLNVNGLNSPN